MNIFDIVSQNSAYFYAIAIVTTIVAIAISTRYSLRNLFNIRVDTDDPSVGNQSERVEASHNDATGNDGDDEAEGDEDENKPSPCGKTISPRYPDPVEYCEHIQGEIKRVKQKVATKSIAETLTEDQLNEEREIQRKQLAEIFRLMEEQQERFGIGSMDDMQEQMKLYAV